jgi:hypothetical protein
MGIVAGDAPVAHGRVNAGPIRGFAVATDAHAGHPVDQEAPFSREVTVVTHAALIELPLMSPLVEGLVAVTAQIRNRRLQQLCRVLRMGRVAVETSLVLDGTVKRSGVAVGVGDVLVAVAAEVARFPLQHRGVR